jgi:hypothetical protein
MGWESMHRVASSCRGVCFAFFWEPRGGLGSPSPATSYPEPEKCFSSAKRIQGGGKQNDGRGNKGQFQMNPCYSTARRQWNLWQVGPTDRFLGHWGTKGIVRPWPFFLFCFLDIK